MGDGQELLRATPAPRRRRPRSSSRATTRSARTSSLSSAHFTAGRWGRCRSPPARAFSGAASARFMPGVYHAPYPDPVPLQRERGRDARPSACAFIADQIFVHLVCARRGRRDRRRADPGGGRIHRAAAGISPGPARAGDTAWDPAGRRRSAVGHGPHGEDVRVRAFRPQRRTSSTSPKGSRRGCRSA